MAHTAAERSLDAIIDRIEDVEDGVAGGVTLPIAESDVTNLVSDLAAKETAGAATSAISAHVGAGDPHTQYALESALGTLSTQNGTFSGTHSGTSSGTNTGDQTNISGNAATVTTNANLTGPITSSGNTTAVASQTGTGSKFVMDTAPTITNAALVTPALGTPQSGVLTNLTGIDSWRGTVFTTAAQTLTNAYADLTPASGPSLAFPVVAGGTYKFSFHIWTVADATTTGIDCAINGPTIGAGSMTYQQRTFSSATAQADNKATAYDTDTAQANSQGAVNRIYIVAGIITLGATAGNVVARVKRENVGSGTIPAACWVDWQRLS